MAHVLNFTYLGAIFSEDGSINLEIDTCISKAREKLLSYRFVWEAEHLSRRLKVNYLFSYVFSVLFYACETWSLKQRNYERLEVFFNFCRLLILRRKRLVNSETISNNELHRLVKLQTVAIVILPWQLTFFFGVVFKPSSLTVTRWSLPR